MGNYLKNTKHNYKGRLLKRLFRESYVLSYFNKLSERILKLFSYRFLYIIFCGSEEADSILKGGVLGSIASKFNFQSFKMFIAQGVENSFIVRFYRHLIRALLFASVRFYGIFSCTFGVYGIGIYIAKRFSYIASDPSESELFWSVFIIIAGAFMLLSGRSTASILKTSRIFKWMFIGVFGVNEMAIREPEKTETYGTVAFVLGTVLGLSTIFIRPSVIVISILVVLLISAILYTPELGLLISIMLFPLISVKFLAILLIITTICYFLKIFRAKRNLSFKTADLFVLFFSLYIVASGLLSQSRGQVRALYLLCFLSAYFLISNLIASEKLIHQALYSLCIGAAASCLLYILQYIAGTSDYIYLSPVWDIIKNSLVGRESFGYFLIIILPVSLALFRINRRKNEKAALLVLSFITFISILITFDKLILTGAFAAIFVYFLFFKKQPVQTLLIFLVISIVLGFIIPYIPFMDDIFDSSYDNLPVSGISDLLSAFLLSGIGIGSQIMLTALNRIGAGSYMGSISLFERLIAEGGLFFLITFLIAVFFILQRAFFCLSEIKNKRVCAITAAFVSAVFMFLILGFFYDIWQDIRIYMLFWIVCGIISAIKNVYGRTSFIEEVND